MLEIDFVILLLFFIISCLYSIVGFGGGSSYVAILSLFGWPFQLLRFVALVCNISVVFQNLIHHYNSVPIPFKKILPLVLCSVPLAFLGGCTRLSAPIYFALLGVTLTVSSGAMYFNKTLQQASISLSRGMHVLIGGGVGYLSGVVGIGGGIFLAPILYLTSWGTEREIAACSSVFILVNSIAGITGQSLHYEGPSAWGYIIPLGITVIAGSFLGNKISFYRLKNAHLRFITATFILIVGVRILWKTLEKI